MIFVWGTGAVSWYKLSRSQKTVTVQDFNCVLMRVSGCSGHYEFVLGAGAKAKSVTNNLSILSVLVKVLFIFFTRELSLGDNTLCFLPLIRISLLKSFDSKFY